MREESPYFPISSHRLVGYDPLFIFSFLLRDPARGPLDRRPGGGQARLGGIPSSKGYPRYFFYVNSFAAFILSNRNSFQRHGSRQKAVLVSS